MADELVDNTTPDVLGALASAGIWAGAAGVSVAAVLVPHITIPLIIAASGAAGGLDKLLNVGAGKKRQEFLQQLDTKFKQMHEELGDAISNAINSDEFFANVSHATVIAIQTAQKTKLEALQNALLNTMLADRRGIDREEILFAAIEALTVAHMKMLNFMADPNRWIQTHTLTATGLRGLNGNMSIYHIFDRVLPELENDPMLFKLLEQDLANRGFIKQVLEGGYTINIHSPISTLATDLGKDFIAFVRSPLHDEPDLFSQSEQENTVSPEGTND